MSDFGKPHHHFDSNGHGEPVEETEKRRLDLITSGLVVIETCEQFDGGKKGLAHGIEISTCRGGANRRHSCFEVGRSRHPGSHDFEGPLLGWELNISLQQLGPLLVTLKKPGTCDRGHDSIESPVFSDLGDQFLPAGDIRDTRLTAFGGINSRSPRTPDHVSNCRSASENESPSQADQEPMLSGMACLLLTRACLDEWLLWNEPNGIIRDLEKFVRYGSISISTSVLTPSGPRACSRRNPLDHRSLAGSIPGMIVRFSAALKGKQLTCRNGDS